MRVLPEATVCAICARDRWRQRPGGVEHRVADRELEDGCLAERLSDLDARLPCSSPVAAEIELEPGNIHDHEPLPDVMKHPATALQIDSDLVNAPLNGRIHGLDGAFAQHSVGSQAMAPPGNGAPRPVSSDTLRAPA